MERDQVPYYFCDCFCKILHEDVYKRQQQKLAESLVQKYGEDVVFVNKVVINDMNFEDAYNEAIQQKSIAQPVSYTHLDVYKRQEQ